MKKGKVDMSDGRQSVNNYNQSDFDFTDRNPENRNNFSSMYNSYVSESNYNSYTTGYQPTSSYRGNNNYNQPLHQNGYNNDFNGYSQPAQRNNNQSLWSFDLSKMNKDTDFVQRNNYNAALGHNAVEIPLPNKMRTSAKITLTAFAVVFISMILLGIISSATGWNGTILVLLMLGIFITGFVVMAFASVFSPIIDRRHNLKVCKIQVRGRLVGYEKKRRSNEGQHYSVYAPKYEIFINNRYEIRTVDLFDRVRREWGYEINLLVNPDGYEIIPAAREDFPKRSKVEIILAIALAVFVIAVFILPILSTLRIF